MVERFLADLVVLSHLLFISFALFGGATLLWRRWMVWLHVPAALWAAAIEFGGWICPLTPLENQLRRAGGAAGYEGGFVEIYLLPLIYPAGLTRGVQMLLGGVVIGVNLGIYLFVFRRASSRCSRGA